MMNQNPVHLGAAAPVATDIPLLHEPSKSVQAGFWALLVVAVLAAYGPLALVNQPFWDDWVMIAYGTRGTLWELFKQLGRREQYILMAPFTGNGDARACVMTVILLYCVLAPLIYVIIRRTTRWPATDTFWAALLTAVAPLDQARFVVSTVPYAFSSVFFALALVVLLLDLDRSSVARRVLVLLLLVMAFSTNSFLVLSWIVPAIVAIDAWRKADHLAVPKARLFATIRALIGRGELFLLPPAYWVGKKLLEPTYGLYSNYNQFRVGLLHALRDTVIFFFKQFGETAAVMIPRPSDLPDLAMAAIMAVALFSLVARFCKLPMRTSEADPSGSDRAADWLTLAAVPALIISALFPYVMVGEPPRFNGLWETRHQTTLLIVSGFSIFSVMRSSVPRRYLWTSGAIVAVVFFAFDVSFTQRMINDALETGEIAQQFRAHPPPPGTMTLVLENDRQYRALGRFLAFPELSTLINSGHSGNPRLAISNQEVIDPLTGHYPTTAVPAVTEALVKLCQSSRDLPQYGFGGFTSNGQIETINLLANREPPTLFQTIKEATRAVSAADPAQASNARVRLERKTAPVGGACRAPCCSNW